MEISEVVNLEESQPSKYSGAGKSGKRCGEHASGIPGDMSPISSPVFQQNTKDKASPCLAV